MIGVGKCYSDDGSSGNRHLVASPVAAAAPPFYPAIIIMHEWRWEDKSDELSSSRPQQEKIIHGNYSKQLILITILQESPTLTSRISASSSAYVHPHPAC